MIVKTDERDVARDVKSMSLVNTNRQALVKHQEEMKKTQEFAQLKTEVSEMKNMLALILEKINGH